MPVEDDGSIIMEDDPNAVLAMCLDKAINDDEVAREEKKLLKSTNGLSMCSAENMVMGVKVEKIM